MKKVKIHFLSSFTQMGNDDNVDFKSVGTISKVDNTTVLKFNEPSNDIETIVSYTPVSAKINSGNSIFNFELNKIIKNVMKTSEGEIVIYTDLKKINDQEQLIYLEYQLTNSNSEVIGYFKITISFE